MQNKGTPLNFDLQDLNSTLYNNDLISNITFIFRMHNVQQQMQQTSKSAAKLCLHQKTDKCLKE